MTHQKHSPLVRSIPAALTTLRLVLAAVVAALAWRGGWRGWFLICLPVGFFSDVFDGIIARRLGVATARLRRFDSATDVVFWIAILLAAWRLEGAVLWHYRWAIAAVLGMEVACNVISLCRWRRPPATHSYFAKAWGILLFVTFTALLGFGGLGALVLITALVGCLVDLEVIAIVLISRRPPVDVPSIVQAIARRRMPTPQPAA